MFKVKVPATSANMGPGFDCIGIALDLYNEVEVYESVQFLCLLFNYDAILLLDSSALTESSLKAFSREKHANTITIANGKAAAIEAI